MGKIIKTIWRRWLSIARPIGNFQSQVILSVFYLVILLPVSLVFKFIMNPFSQEKNNSSFRKWEYPTDDLKSARKPF